MSDESKKKGYQWRFFRSGGFDQVRIETASPQAKSGVARGILPRSAGPVPPIAPGTVGMAA